MSDSATSAVEVESSANDLRGRYLTFQLGEGSYGIPIVRIQEIIGVSQITRVPRANEYLKGIMNLRGKVIPVIDLRILLGMPERTYDDRTCFVVVHSQVKGDTISCGLIVDCVTEVIDFAPTEITETASGSFNGENHFVMGFGRREKHVSMLIDIDDMLTAMVESRKVGFHD